MNSLLQKSWIIKTPYELIPVMDRVTRHRSLDLENELTELHSPWTMKGMKKAIERIAQGIKDEERIMIFGDYDVDGVCGASILYLGMKELGANVSVRLPHRERDGYGLNMKVIEECLELGVKILITVDCGISNVKQVAYGMSKGIDVIVTDHHSIPNVLPKAFAVLNPKQKDCEYPEKEIVGSVVAFKLLSALSAHHQQPTTSNQLYQFLDLAALATVADCAPLRGENRLIVKLGLEQMRETKHRGLRKLLDSYPDTSNQKPITSYHLGFKIAPCINAAGRLEDPMMAFSMMLGDEAMALELRELNEERQGIVKSALEEALKIVEQKHSKDPVIVIWHQQWQPGIIGLLAGKLCEHYGRPAICLTLHGDKYVGSCRSIPEINIVDELRQCEDLFIGYGGHAQAAGLSILEKNLEPFRNRLHRSIGERLKDRPLEPALFIDTEIMPEEISLATSRQLTSLEPFGMGNHKPKFLLKAVTVLETRIVGKDLTHLQLSLATSEGEVMKGIAFQMAEHQSMLESWKIIDLVCQLNKNEWNGKVSIDLQLVDARQSGESP